jgi:DNA-binding transcriptional LysR family regulator
MVERGLGVAIVPERAVGEAHRQRIVVSPIDDLEAVRNVSLVFRGRAINLPLLEVVLASFQSAAKGVR